MKDFLIGGIIAGMIVIFLSIIGCDLPTTTEESYDLSLPQCGSDLTCPSPRAGFCCPQGYPWTGTEKSNDRCYTTQGGCEKYYGKSCIKCGT